MASALRRSASRIGELVLSNDKFSYKSWNSAQLVGKVRVVQHIAGRSSAKEKNATLIEAIKSAKLPHDRYQTTTIVNTDDAIPGSGMFVRSSIESNKQLYPWSQFIVDSNGVVRKAWQLNEESSAIVVLDKDGRVQWAKDGALSQKRCSRWLPCCTSCSINRDPEAGVEERFTRRVIKGTPLPVVNVRPGGAGDRMTGRGVPVEVGPKRG